MATYRFPSTGTKSYDGGKYYIEVTVTSTTAGMSFSVTYHITKAFDNLRWAWLYVYDEANNKWISTKTPKQHKGVADWTNAGPSLVAETAKFKVKMGTDEWDETEVESETPLDQPTDVTVVQNNVASHTITVTGQGYPTKHADKLIVERCEDRSGSWSQIGEDITVSNPTGKYTESITDNTTSSGHTYKYRAKVHNDTTGKDSAYTESEEKTTNPGSNVISGEAVTVSNNVATVTWSCDVSNVNSGVVTGFNMSVSKDGGAYDDAGTVQATTSTTSYSWNYNVANGSSYSFGIQPYGDGGTAFEKVIVSTTIETKPASPTSVTAYRNTSNGITVNINGGNDNVEKVYLDRSADGGSNWTTLVNGEDYPVATYNDNAPPSSTQIKYRAKFYNAQGYSDYTYSNIVSSLCAPEAPDLISPENGAPVDLTANTVRLTWKHRPLDGSPQTAAYIQYRVNSGSWQTITVTTATYYDLNITTMSANDEIEWKVSTKGSYATASAYSPSRTFKIRTKPTLAFTQPQNASTITTLPVVLAWNYNDLCGTLEKLTVNITKNNTIVKTFNVDVGAGTSGSYSYSLAGFLFDNNTVYGITASALSSSGLSATQTISVTIAYAPVSIHGALVPSAFGDSENGYARIIISRDVSINPDTQQPYTPVSISAAYLYRVHDDEKTLVGVVSEGQQIIDKYAPINVQFEYELLQITAQSQVSLVDVALTIESPYWFCFFGNETAKAKWNPEGSVKLGRPQRTEVRYSGRRYPVSYDQDAIEETFDFTTVFTEREDLNQFRRLMRQGGTGIWKSGDGDVYDANFEFSYSADYRLTTPIWNASLSVTRIDGGDD